MSEKRVRRPVGEVARQLSASYHQEFDRTNPNLGTRIKRRLHTGNMLVYEDALTQPFIVDIPKSEEPIIVNPMADRSFRSVAAPEVKPLGRAFYDLLNGIRLGRAESEVDKLKCVYPPTSNDVLLAERRAADEAIQRINRDARRGNKSIIVIGPEGPIRELPKRKK
jgi:hypothetical protein